MTVKQIPSPNITFRDQWYYKLRLTGMTFMKRI
jgi:hypothetical protein